MGPIVHHPGTLQLIWDILRAALSASGSDVLAQLKALTGRQVGEGSAEDKGVTERLMRA